MMPLFRIIKDQDHVAGRGYDSDIQWTFRLDPETGKNMAGQHSNDRKCCRLVTCIDVSFLVWGITEWLDKMLTGQMGPLYTLYTSFATLQNVLGLYFKLKTNLYSSKL